MAIEVSSYCYFPVDCWQAEMWCGVARNAWGVAAITFGHDCYQDAVQALHRQLGIGPPLVRTNRMAATSYSSPPSVWPAGVGSADRNLLDSSQEPLAGRLAQFLAGTPVSWDDEPIDLTAHTRFQRAVVAACRAVPWGETITYGELAKRAGHPGAARAVGSVMSSNRVPLLVPCHRVVGAQGHLGGYSAPQGLAMKRRLLRQENATSHAAAGAPATFTHHGSQRDRWNCY